MLSSSVRVRWFLLALVAAGGLGWFVLHRPPEKPQTPAPETWVGVWNQGLLACDQFQFADAEAAFRQICEALPRAADAWTNVGIACMNQDLPDAYVRAETAFRRALDLSPLHLHANHCLGVLLKHLSRFSEAEGCFRKVLQRDPGDPTANYYLGTLLVAAGQEAEAEERFRLAITNEPHQQSAVFNLFNLYYRTDREPLAEPLVALFRELERTETGATADIVYSEMGRYGYAIRSFPGVPPQRADLSGGVTFRVSSLDGSDLASAAPVPTSVPINGDIAAAAETFAVGFGPGAAAADVDGDGDLDVFVAGTQLGRLWINDGTGQFSDRTQDFGIVGTRTGVSACFGDLDNDGHPELYVCCVGENHLFQHRGSTYEDVTAATGTGGGDVLTSQAVMADLDADGDLDIFCAQLASLDQGPTSGRFPDDAPGAADRLFNNNRDGTYTDIAPRTGLASEGPSNGVVAADLDGDRDADLLVLKSQAPAEVFQNDRAWRFRALGTATGLGGEGSRGACLADISGDGVLDILLLGGDGGLYAGVPGSAYFPLAILDPTFTESLASGAVFDADNDGDLDVLIGPGHLYLQRDGGVFTPLSLPESVAGRSDIRSIIPADLNGDGVLDLLLSRTGGAPILMTGQLETSPHWLELDLVGVREEGKMRANAGGLGARATVVSGFRHQTQESISAISVLGCPPARLHFGLGRASTADYVSIQWPDDLLQGEASVSAGQVKRITETYRKSSSCPLLFVWDGNRMAFVTDFLGTGGLGFYVGPGRYADPDPTERVAIPEAIPRNGAYDIRVHEPMEEICYLDSISILEVDAPDGLVVLPDERLATNPPWPEDRLIAFDPNQARFPTAGSDGRGPFDVECLLKADRRYQPGIRPDPRFMGYADPQTLVLDFGDALRTRDLTRPFVLFLEGWVEYPYSHVNFAAAQAGLTLQSLTLEVETSPGEFATYASEFGYPAGMPRVMTFDVSEIPTTGTGRIRFTTNLELYIDRIWLATDLADSRVTVRRLHAQTAILKPSGYPREYSPDGREPLLYDYAWMDPAIDYKNMAGDYTRWGDVAPLLQDADDCYVIMGRGEEVRMTFAASPPPGPGFARSVILDSVGWCKDMDLYTAFPNTVEPLPFRGMSSYPYPPSEQYPDSPIHQHYRQTWNTRRISNGARSGQRR